MLDLARVAALLFALAACRRPRFVVGAVAAGVIALLLAWEIGAPLARHDVGEAGVGSAFALAFLGPAGLTPRAWATLAEALVAGVASKVAFSRALPLRPENPTARAWDAAGLRFLFIAILDGILVVLDLMLARLMRDA